MTWQTDGTDKVMRSLAQFLRFCEDEMLKEQAPYKVNPTNEHTGESNYNRCDERDNALCLEECRPSDANFYNPVYKRNQQQKALNQTTLLVKPCCHNNKPPYAKSYRIYISIVIIAELYARFENTQICL